MTVAAVSRLRARPTAGALGAALSGPVRLLHGYQVQGVDERDGAVHGLTVETAELARQISHRPHELVVVVVVGVALLP